MAITTEFEIFLFLFELSISRPYIYVIKLRCLGNLACKGECLEIFITFFIFIFCEDIHENSRKTGVCLVVDFVDAVSV